VFLSGELLASLGTPSSKDGAASTGPHAKPKAVRLRTLAVIWLECALHGNDSLRPVMVEGRQRSGAEMAPKHRWYGPAKAGVNAAGWTMRCRDTTQRTEGSGPGSPEAGECSLQALPCMARGSASLPRRWPRSHRLGLSLPWGQRWGRAVDERGTTAGDAIDQPNLGTTMEAVPSPILTATHPVSSADRCPSTCPQDLRLFRISLSLHPFKPIAWGRGGSMSVLLRPRGQSTGEASPLSTARATYPQYEEGRLGEGETTTEFGSLCSGHGRRSARSSPAARCSPSPSSLVC